MTAPVSAGLSGSAADLTVLEPLGLRWYDSGQASLRGPLLRLAQECDLAFGRLASRWHATEEYHPATLPARELHKVDYLRNFPHQASFAAAFDPDPDNLTRFTAGPVLDEATGTVVPGALRGLADVLTPATCYHMYVSHQGEHLADPLFLTSRNRCFRQEEQYVPLRRLRSFTMREVVCIGTGEEVTDFLGQSRALLDAFFVEAGMELPWEAATDPFFRAGTNPKHLMQRMMPVKFEAVHGGYGSDPGKLAIASLNRHHETFGAAFAISRRDAPAESGCTAFGLERWLFTVVDRFGTDPVSWPDLPAAADRALARAVADTATWGTT